MNPMRSRFALVGLCLALGASSGVTQDKDAGPAPLGREMAFDNPTDLLNAGSDQKKALKVHDAIYQAIGFGNTFLVVTPAGNVIIDTSRSAHAPRHVKLLRAESAAPVRYIVLTHVHPDHTGGIAQWKEPGTQVVAQKQHVEFANYQARLQAFFALRNAAQ